MTKPEKFYLLVGIIGLVHATAGCDYDLENNLAAAQQAQRELLVAVTDLQAEVAESARADKTEVSRVLDRISAVQPAVGEVIEAAALATSDPVAGLEAAGAVAGGLPIPYAPLIGLALTTIAGFVRARMNRLAGRAIAGRIEMASKMSPDGKIDLADPKTKLVLSTMGRTATRIVRESQGKENSLGV